MQDIRHSLEKAIEQGGVKPFGPHHLRHSFAQDHVDNGTPAPVLASYMGHSSTRSLNEVYTKATTENKRKATENLFEVWNLS